MQHRFPPAVRTCAVAILAGLLSACGGGHGGSTPPVGPTGIPAPPPVGAIAAGTPQSNAGGSGGGTIKTDTNFAITTNPAGLTVTADGVPLGTTPTSYVPTAQAGTANQLVFSGNSSTSYTIDVMQTRDGARTLYYNAAADSSGTIDTTSIKAAARSSLNVTAAAGQSFVRRPFALHAGTKLADVVPNEFVVRYKPASLSSSSRQPAAIERGLGVTGKSLPTTGDPLRAVVVPTDQSPADFARKLAAMPEVAYVHPVHVRHLLTRAATAVNDPLYIAPNDQWYLSAIGAPFAWTYSTGGNATIAVIDTGFDNNNTDLFNKVTRQGKAVTPVDSSGNVSATPATLITGANAAQDSNGHGTSVSGLAGALTNNGYGLASLGYNVKLFVYDVFADTTVAVQDPGANGVDEATAIDDAVSHGADIISLSLGSPSSDDAEQSAVDFAISKGVTVVAAAGNNADGQDGSGNAAAIGTLDFPGAYDGVISVGASALNDGNTSGTNDGVYAGSAEFVASYSQYGTGLGLVAPGGSVNADTDADVLHWILTYSTTTTPVTKNKCTQKNGTCLSLFAGTSQATPEVSAAAALLLSLAGGHGALTPAQIAQVLYRTADNINDPHQGHGRLNVYRALASYLHDTSTTTGPTAIPTGPSQFVAFAYNNHGANRPTILDVNFPNGVPVDLNSGAFRIADVPASAGSYTVGVWYDANGNGYIDSGDQVGFAAVACSATAACSIGTLTVKTVNAPFALP